MSYFQRVSFLHHDSVAIRFAALAVAVVVYAIFGSPTPNVPGFSEFAAGFFLVCAVGTAGLRDVLRFYPGQPLWRSAGQALLFYGMTVSLANAALRGQSPGLIVRDIAPFLFMLLPLFLGDIFMRRPVYAKYFAGLVVFLGCVFSVRALPEIYAWWFPAQGSSGGELYYFANAPSVLLAALLPFGLAATGFVRRFSLRSMFSGVCLIVLAALPLAAVVLSLQRAGVGYFVLFGVFIFLLALKNHPQRAGFLALLLIAAIFPFAPSVWEFLRILLEKTSLVGFNMRGQELAAVWDEISVSPLFQFFGAGWGGTFESPAVAGVRVNYTHSLFSSSLLKTGFFGTLLLALYLGGLTQVLMRLLMRSPVLGLAIAGPFLIDVFLYASFKSLDFGLLLLLLVALGAAAGNYRNVATAGPLLYSTPSPGGVR